MQENQKTESQDASDVFKDRGFQKIDKAVNQSIAIVKQAKLGKRNVLATSSDAALSRISTSNGSYVFLK